ncbi:hypothetical protein ACIBH1_33525 [Nonomuraea sp. NPDC050663]|uniref:hypothetical protein n=1 Tax=Nonomuraea sp. NPDC050663 TaxID=3364370 RepID=UPI0037942A67
MLGAGTSPLFVVAWLATDTLVPDEERTEASTWLDTANNLGLTAGAAVAGILAERSDPGLALVAGAGVLAVTALIARLSGRAVDRI